MLYIEFLISTYYQKHASVALCACKVPCKHNTCGLEFYMVHDIEPEELKTYVIRNTYTCLQYEQTFYLSSERYSVNLALTYFQGQLYLVPLLCTNPCNNSSYSLLYGKQNNDVIEVRGVLKTFLSMASLGEGGLYIGNIMLHFCIGCTQRASCKTF